MSERIIVTGAAGFIGSNIVRTLNNRGYTDILVVDDLTAFGCSEQALWHASERAIRSQPLTGNSS